MVMTILEGQVAQENWPILEQAYEEAKSIAEPGLVQSFLTQDAREPGRWRIMTLWSSREALDAMRDRHETPRGVLMFRQAHSEPQLSIFNVIQQINAK